MNNDGFVNQSEREAAAELKVILRTIRSGLRTASELAQRAGFGDQIQQELEETLSRIQYIRAEYDLV